MGMDKEGGKEKKRRSGASKALDLVLRCGHIGAASILFGGLVLSVPFTRLTLWHSLAIASGAALILAGICQSRHWPYQGRGLMALVHIGLLGLLHHRHDLMLPVLTAVLVFGVIGSNMPGYLRHWSVLHGQRMD
jgi:uncharacterized membrane protein HdeD (DUF308 family)